MNKKEISEIKKTLSLERNSIGNICGCYVNGEKNIKFTSVENFQALPDEDAYKYCEIFKKALSGGINKTLINLDFPTESEFAGGTQEFLMKLRESKLKDKNILQDFYQRIIDNYEYAGNYYIIIFSAIYDIPGKTSDGIAMNDASDEVYDHIMCCICPVDLSKPGLGYNEQTNHMEERIRDWIVGLPTNAFLFPAFNDRCADVHSVLYYAKNTKNMSAHLIENVLGTPLPVTADNQKILFDNLLTEVMGDEITFNNIKFVNEAIVQKIEEEKENNGGSEINLSKTDIENIINQSDLSEEKKKNFHNAYKAVVGELEENNTLNGFYAESVTDPQKLTIETAKSVIRVKGNYSDSVQTKIIDGKKYLLIEAEDFIKINGIAGKFL